MRKWDWNCNQVIKEKINKTLIRKWDTCKDLRVFLHPNFIEGKKQSMYGNQIFQCVSHLSFPLPLMACTPLSLFSDIAGKGMFDKTYKMQLVTQTFRQIFQFQNAYSMCFDASKLPYVFIVNTYCFACRIAMIHYVDCFWHHIEFEACEGKSNLWILPTLPSLF